MLSQLRGFKLQDQWKQIRCSHLSLAAVPASGRPWRMIGRNLRWDQSIELLGFPRFPSSVLGSPVDNERKRESLEDARWSLCLLLLFFIFRCHYFQNRASWRGPLNGLRPWYLVPLKSKEVQVKFISRENSTSFMVFPTVREQDLLSFQNFQGSYKSCFSTPASLNLKQGGREGGRVIGGKMGMNAQMGACINLINEEAWQIILNRSLLLLYNISSADFKDAFCLLTALKKPKNFLLNHSFMELKQC